MTTTTLTDPVSGELRTILRALKLGKLLDTLPERITLAKQHHLPHADFLELVLADEVARRDTNSAALRARAAGLDPGMRLDTWDTTAAVRYDQQLWTELTSLRFLNGPHGALLLGPVGVGKTHLATALGHIAVRRRHSVHMARADKLFKRLKAARLDNTVEAEMRRLAHVQLLILDDFALQPLDATETTDFYELIVERHRKTATVLTSNREPSNILHLLAPWAITFATSEGKQMTESGQVQSVVVLDPSQVAAARSLAAAHGLKVEEVPQRGIEPVTTVTVVLIGAVAAVGAVLHILEQRKGGQVIDLRPGAPKMLYRTADVVYGTVVIITVDGRVTVEVKEPDGMFGKMIATLPQLLSGSDSAGQVNDVITKTFGTDVRVDTIQIPAPGGDQ